MHPTGVLATTPDRVEVFIDGFNLYFGLVDARMERYKWLDFLRLSQRLNPPRELQRVHYFTARVTRDQAAERRQNNYLEALEAHCGNTLRIIHGRMQIEPRTCPSCATSFESRVEKHTDVNIAAEMIRGAYEDRYDTAMLISGDADQVAAVELVVSLGKTVRVVFPPERESTHLGRAASTSYVLKEDQLRLSQLPDIVRGRHGVDLIRPASWR